MKLSGADIGGEVDKKPDAVTASKIARGTESVNLKAEFKKLEIKYLLMST